MSDQAIAPAAPTTAVQSPARIDNMQASFVPITPSEARDMVATAQQAQPAQPAQQDAAAAEQSAVVAEDGQAGDAAEAADAQPEAKPLELVDGMIPQDKLDELFVTVPDGHGGEMTMSLRDLHAGGLRLADYTKKTQALSAKIKQADDTIDAWSGMARDVAEAAQGELRDGRMTFKNPEAVQDVILQLEAMGFPMFELSVAYAQKAEYMYDGSPAGQALRAAHEQNKRLAKEMLQKRMVKLGDEQRQRQSSGPSAAVQAQFKAIDGVFRSVKLDPKAPGVSATFGTMLAHSLGCDRSKEAVVAACEAAHRSGQLSAKIREAAVATAQHVRELEGKLKAELRAKQQVGLSAKPVAAPGNAPAQRGMQANGGGIMVSDILKHVRR